MLTSKHIIISNFEVYLFNAITTHEQRTNTFTFFLFPFYLYSIRHTLYAIRCYLRTTKNQETINMQNKPNLLNAKMKLSFYLTRNYGNKPPLGTMTKQTQSNPTFQTFCEVSSCLFHLIVTTPPPNPYFLEAVPAVQTHLFSYGSYAPYPEISRFEFPHSIR